MCDNLNSKFKSKNSKSIKKQIGLFSANLRKIMII